MHAPISPDRVLTGADLTLNAGHKYWRPDGQRVPSVTEIIREVGVSTDFEELIAMGGPRAAAIEYKRALGTAVHADTHSVDDDAIKWETVHPDVLPYLKSWQTFKENQRLFHIQRERRLYSPTLGVCGTLDGIFYRVDNCEHAILIDIKTGDPESAGARYQTAGYQLLWEEEHPDQPIAERWSVELTPEHKVPYRIHQYTDWTDRAAFRAFVTTYYAQAARRRAS